MSHRRGVGLWLADGVAELTDGMSVKQSTSVVSKILTFSLLLSACVGGAALQASAEQHLTHDVSEPASAEPANDGPVTAQDLMAAGGTLNVRGVYRWNAGATFDLPQGFVVGQYKLANSGFNEFYVVNNKFGPHELITKWNGKIANYAMKGSIEFDVTYREMPPASQILRLSAKSL